jgi:hypothetical protein
MDNTYDVYLTGTLLGDGTEQVAVEGLVELFTLKETDAKRLVDGKRRRVKTGCDKSTALKYRERLQAIGIEISIERHLEAATEESAAAPASIAAQPAAASLGKSAQFDSRDLGDKTILYEPPPPEKPSPVTEFSLAPTGSRLSEEPTELPTPSAMTEFSLAPPGDLIPSVPVTVEALNPQTDHLSLVQSSGEGSDDA